MTLQFKREVRVTVGNTEGKVLQGNKISFEVEKSIISYPNLARISIHNLRDVTRQQIKDEFQRVILEVGYNGEFSVLFKGDIRNAFHRRDNADIVTDIYSADGDFDFRTAVVNEVVEGVGSRDVVGALVDKFARSNLSLVEIDNVESSGRPRVLSGTVKDKLDELGRAFGFNWSIQDGEVEVTQKEKFVNEVVLISEATGMRGTPTVTIEGVNVATLLNPAIRPNRLVKVQSKFGDVQVQNLQLVAYPKIDSDLGGGLFRVNKAVYIGDNRDGDFLVQVEGQRVDGNRVV